MGEAVHNLDHQLAILQDRDPTRSQVLRERFAADGSRRVAELERAIRHSIVVQDVFDLRGPREPIVLQDLDVAEFRRLTDSQRLETYMVWLREQEKQGMLELARGPTGPEPWSNTYIRSSYQKGLAQGQAKLASKGVDLGGVATEAGLALPGGASVAGAFQTPFHQDRVQLAYTRTWQGLQGITEQMNARIAKTIAEGIVEGIGPAEMASRLTKRQGESPLGHTQVIGRNRFQLIARTETVQVLNEASTFEYTRAEGVIGEEIFVEWLTARDERVRDTGRGRGNHRRRQGEVFSKSDFLRLVGDPNCLPGDAMAYSPGGLERVYKRFYDGLLVIIKTAAGDEIPLTPNHPVLTPTGLVPA